MIIFRYLAREVLISMIAVSAVLLLIIMSGRFVKLLAEAATGKLSPEILFAVMGYRLPGFLELILPLGLFIAILLAYGRLYTDSEMTVLSACGISPQRLLFLTFFPALVVAILVGMLALFVSPLGVERSEALIQIQKLRSEIDFLKPGRFQELQKGSSVTYAKSLSPNHKKLNQVFMAEMADRGDEPGALSVIFARTGEQYIDKVTGQKYLLLKDGYRYSGNPGEADYQEIAFASYAQYLQPVGKINPNKIETDAIKTAALWGADDLQLRSTLQWRLSLPLLVLILTLLAVPLSKTNPRQGKYAQMIPAILIYIVYLVGLNAARGFIEDGKLSADWGMLMVHSIFLSLGLVMVGRESLMAKLRSSRMQTVNVA